MKTISLLIFMFVLTNICSFSQSLTGSEKYKQMVKERQERERKWLSEMNDVSADFPKNVVVLEYWPSCLKGIHYYYPNGKYVFQHLHGTPTEIGTWTRDGNKIMISITQEIGMRNFGTPLNVDELGGRDDCPKEIYEISFKYEHYVSRQSEFVLGDYFHADRYIDTTKKACDFEYEEQVVDGDYKIASCRLLTANDIDHLNKSELRLMRNEIFARYGYLFKDIKLQAHFSKMHWYIPIGKDVNKYLTQLEKDNIELIQEFEKK